MKNLFRMLLIAVLTLGVVSTTATSCKQAGKVAKEMTKKSGKVTKKGKVRPPMLKTCSRCGSTYRGYDCPNC